MNLTDRADWVAFIACLTLYVAAIILGVVAGL